MTHLLFLLVYRQTSSHELGSIITEQLVYGMQQRLATEAVIDAYKVLSEQKKNVHVSANKGANICIGTFDNFATTFGASSAFGLEMDAWPM